MTRSKQATTGTLERVVTNRYAKGSGSPLTPDTLLMPFEVEASIRAFVAARWSAGSW